MISSYRIEYKYIIGSFLLKTRCYRCITVLIITILVIIIIKRPVPPQQSQEVKRSR